MMQANRVPMRIRRTLPVFLGVLIIAVAITAAVQLRKLAPPEAARLLPSADAFFYLDVGWVRRLNGGKALPPVTHDPQYEQFIQATGFEFERDLEEAAFAVQYPPSQSEGLADAAAREPRFSEVFVGRFQGERLSAYLRKIARAVEDYRSVDVFTIPVENRILRVAVLGPDLVAASNQADEAVIEGMIDRSKKLASPFGGPSLLRQYYRQVQLGSLSWLIARVEPEAPGLGQWGALLSGPATIVVSGTFLNPLHLHTNAIHLLAQAFTQSPDQAHALTNKITAFFALTDSAESSLGTHGTDADVKAFFESLKVKQEGSRAQVSANLPLGFVHKMLSGSVPESEPGPAETTPANPK